MDQISGTSPADAQGQPLQAPTGVAVSDSGAAASEKDAPASDPAAPTSETGAAASDPAAPARETGAPASDPAVAASAGGPADRREVDRPGFGSRGRARRRARFLRKARELAYRDLGGLVFNLHRFGQRNDALVLAKLNTLTQIDTELRTLEDALREREPVTVLREAGITACPRCAAIHSSEDRFCPNCGLSMARHVDLPIAGAAGAAPSPGAPAPVAPAPSASTPPTPTDGATAPFPAPSDGTAAPVPARPPEEATEILRPGAPRP